MVTKEKVRSKSIKELALEYQLCPNWQFALYRLNPTILPRDNATQIMTEFRGQIVRTAERVFLLIDGNDLAAIKIEGDVG